MSSQTIVTTVKPPPKAGVWETERKDYWWLEPLVTVVGLVIGFGYLTWAAVMGNPAHGEYGPYLSPVYSPPVHHWFPSILSILPAGISPALLILWAPGGFRATCYYYRKAYYRSFFQNPTACAVGRQQDIPVAAGTRPSMAVGRQQDIPVAAGTRPSMAVGKPWDKYCGETDFPLILQNVHRYFLYLAILVLAFLWYDAIHAFTKAGPKDYAVGGGSLVLLLNAVFLSLYTFGCHSLRHLIGGQLDCFSACPTAKARHAAWSGVTCLNERHMLWAWVSLAWVGFTDLYIRLVSSGVISDPRFF